jgi:GcrA cell cycle regulator
MESPRCPVGRDAPVSITLALLSQAVQPVERNCTQVEVEAMTMIGTQTRWTTERIALLKNRIDAGLSCGQIAREIGVSRNAVIGKLSRLNLTRDGEVRPPPRKRAAKGQRPKTRPRLQYQMLKALYGEPQPVAYDEPIHNGHCCSLLELSEERCRWPISTPGLADFCFCGNTPLQGLPYCPGHTRLAYRPGSRQRVVRG